MEIPVIWTANAALAFPDRELNPLSLSEVVAYAAVLFGLAAGVIWIRTRGGFDAGGFPWKRVVRVLLGLIGAVVLYIGLDLVFPGGEDMIALILRYLRYALVGLWVSGLAPMIFIRLKLAESAH